ncbi:MAG: hypothetical protein J1F64_09425, partial [Oscillospiraceae bacterium]|nr:hypothetical protein [Oscillospiraceae bacterium]
FGVPGKHPMEKLCPSCYADGAENMTPTQAEETFGVEKSCSSKPADADIEKIVAEVTKRILENYNK